MPKADEFFALADFIEEWAAGDLKKEIAVVVVFLLILFSVVYGISQLL
jgi:hypothetical protein